jgi:hypothetical protein
MAMRQPMPATASDSGTPASTPPRLPISSDTPVTVAKRLPGNQCPASFMHATKATATEAPTRPRPSVANHRLSASAKRKMPNAAATAAPAPTRRGPTASASSPLGTCIAA